MSEKQVIEIGGVKLEVDMRYAKRIDTVRIGDPVRVLVKSYGETFVVHSGVVIGFEPFAKRPTIIIAYMVVGYSDAEVKFLHLNEDSKDVEVVAVDDDARVAFDEADALKALARKIEKAEADLKDMIGKRQYFIDHIGAAWRPVTLDQGA